MRCSAQFTPPPLREMRGAERCIDEQPSSVVNASVIPLSRCRRARAQAPSRRLHRAELPCSVAVADQETTRLAEMHALRRRFRRSNSTTCHSHRHPLLHRHRALSHPCSYRRLHGFQ